MATQNKLTRINRLVSDLTAQDVGALPAGARAADASKLEGKTKAQVVSEARANLVPTSRAINSKPLTGDVTLTHTDVGAAPVSHTHDYIPNNKKGVAEGVATLDSTGKIPQGQLPAIAIKETFPVKSEAEMLALVAQEGDMAIRSDLRKSFVLMRQPASTLANWQELLTPTDAVSSVNGQRGNVVLEATDVGAEPAFSKNTAFNKNFGNAAGTVMEGNDSRVVNAVPNTRTINGHALSQNIELTAEDVGALGAGETAANAAKLENSTKAQIISEARSGLAASGASYTKAESDGKYATKASVATSIKDAIRTVDITVEAASTTVTLPAGTITAVLVLSVCGVMQNAGVWSLSGNTITFGEQLQAGDIVTVIGFK
ncbi:TPA: hypothetical protein I7259_20440 [Vibrio parahaemolyticus]|uniref:hypothetical protein n=1 Tax=Vibrio parahaemolyticus TaxID=670 RepID=UPI00111FD815|nr:hypothetical protein [Vibrio parahaemolyticus]MBE3718139.1 hypothetical protein [Vibrio parahaemolyticus]MBE3923480.1 hypothetical protein [Vibrio parahaemolyticus]MBE4151263.1 hypothetical protein [Vibrio parahaemolyticus]MBE4182388.1 hypothetical protein [Vibrio parahaemolyticus]TOI24911.1 hypothetical protein CGI64_20485 [Vibrio parahaemolyticus]